MLASASVTTGRSATSVAERLLVCACLHFGVTQEDIRSKNRSAQMVRARWALSFVLIDRVGWSLTRVGELLHKHHTAILHGWRESRALLRTDEDFFDAVQLLERQL